jgi:hypothetical protein
MPKTLYEVFNGEPDVPHLRALICQHVQPAEIDAFFLMLKRFTLGTCDPCRTHVIEAVRQYLGGDLDSHSA